MSEETKKMTTHLGREGFQNAPVACSSSRLDSLVLRVWGCEANANYLKEWDHVRPGIAFE